jgi:2-haloacid dehalogenase
MNIKNIIFDFGGVLVDWNPRYLYKSAFNEDEKMEWFLKNICTDEWNVEQDRGRSLADGTQLLLDKHPEYSDLIKMYYEQWEVMLRSDIPETVKLLYQLKPHYHLYGLTNWSSETFPIAYKRYSFFNEFEGIVVSGDEKRIKPDPKIFELILERYNLKTEETLFIDDNIHNINQANLMGFNTIHFLNPEQLRMDLNILISKLAD